VLTRFQVPIGWLELTKRTVRDSIEDGLPALAAQLAFYFFLALFPALLFFLSLLSYLPVEPAFETMLARLDAFVPADVLTLVRRQIDAVLTGDHGGLMTIAIAGAVWSSSTAMTAIISALNQAYDIGEFRSWWRTRLTAIWLTLALSVFTVLAFGLVIGGADLAAWVARQIGAGELFASVWTLAQWPVALALIVVAVDLVYYFAPNADLRWTWVTPGSLLATSLWLLASVAFKLYVQNFSNYTAVYGAIGSIIVLLLWFYLSGLALLAGAELNAEIEKARRQRGRPPSR
jgi:membrane protein